jgi:uncharacterized RDD family membrane protein YckC
MNAPSRNLRRYPLLLGVLLLLTGFVPAALAKTVMSATITSDNDSDTQNSQPHAHEHWREHWRYDGPHAHMHVNDDENSVVAVGHDSTLAAGEHADDVVSILGSSTSAGDVAHAVVSVVGNTRVTGPVGENAVAVLGSVYVDSKVDGDVVAVLGDIELGPQADVGGNLVSVGGTVKRDPASQVHGNSQTVSIGNARALRFERLRPWIEHCLLLGRPLAFVPGIGWAWTLAFVSLALYLFAALLFGPAVERCVHTLEKYPGQSLLTMLLTLIATPIVFVVLCITVIGILALPFLGIGLLLMKFFGKLVVLAWIGRRIVKPASTSSGAANTALAVLVGGLIVMLLYVVPVLGFIVYQLLSLIGMGVVVYTLLLLIRERRAATASTAAGAAPPAAPGGPQMSSAPGASAQAFAASAEAAAPPEGGAATGTATGAGAAAMAQPAGVRSRVDAAAAVALPRAGFWIRMAALLLDVILVAVVLHFIDVSGDLFLIFLAAYGAVMWKLRGSTVGGIVCNLAVVRHDGREMDWGTSFVRALSSFLSLIAVGLGFIWIAIDPENRAWHDKIAGTIVVRVP